jgi:betaine-aldehyde dehydrogenase
MAFPLPSTLPKLEDCLPRHFGLYYDGQWHEPVDGSYVETFNPGTGKVITKVAFAGAADTEAALKAAQKALPAWRATPPLQRGKLLKKAAQVFREHAVELALLDAANIGSPITIMASDAHFAAEYLDYYAGLIPAVTGETVNLGDKTFNYTVREPLGVVARIVASNHPMMFTGTKMGPPLAMGNTLVIKTPEQAPLSALRLMELLGDIFPPGVLNVVSGGIECGKTLATHPIVRKVTLIGSVPTGRAIQKAAADSLKLTVLELGGKNALIGYPDANVDRLVDGIIAGMNWAWCGQSCGSTSRVFLHHEIHDKVLDLVKAKLEQSYRPGDPLDPKTTMGSLVNKAAQDRVLRYIDIGKKEGARIITGGEPPQTEDCRGGYFVLPTIFADVSQDMRIAKEEIFGPVLSVLKWTDEAKLYEEVNSVEYGLTGAVFTADMTTAQHAIRSIEAATVWVNTSATHFLGMPWGGYKQSGIGREDCFEEMVEMTQRKAVHVGL